MSVVGLRGFKPTSKKGRLKAFVYGESGSGKSFFCTQFPKPYYIDTEKGVERSKYVENIEKNDGVVFQTRKFDELFFEIKQLAKVTHDFQTLVIDPITPIYTNLVDQYMKSQSANSKKKYGSQYEEANRDFKKLVNWLLLIDMNVIVTAHSKDKYGPDMGIIGTTFDAYKKIHYMFDEVYEVGVSNGKHIATCKKTRLCSLKADEKFDFSYQTFSKFYEEELKHFEPTPVPDKKENSVKEIEDRAKELLKEGDIKLIDPISKETLTMLLDIIGKTPSITPEIVQKWREHFGIKEFSELREFQAQRLLLQISLKLTKP